ncbi:MAG TPA: octanoyltransferase, partial [Alteromonas macleodii]|nr:octanoyltransferase [Alteromonas macleodii]
MNEQSIASDANGVIVRQLGRQPYEPIFEAMKRFTDERYQNTQDEIWLV